MGDRVLMQCHHSGTGAYGPTLYGHWSGQDAPAIVARFKERMRPRAADVAEASACLLQEIMRDVDSVSGFGAWNAGGLLTVGDSCGDAGVILVDVATADFNCTCFGGYLESDGCDPYIVED